MSVAAMTMDDQRPLMNSYDKMPTTKYDPNLHSSTSSGGSGAAAGAGVVAGGVGAGALGLGGVISNPSGPASPTPSVIEEQQQQQQQQPSHHHQHHHVHQHHQSQQTQEPLPHHLHQQQQTQEQQQQHQQKLQQHQHNAAVVDSVVAAEQRRLLEVEIDNLKMEQTRMAMQFADAQRREKILMRRLANKEQEFQDYVSQIAEYKAQQAPTALALRTALLDPAVNLLFERLKKELKATKAKLEETQNELSAWKFTPDSNTGKRLMAKCRLLYQENEELGKMTSNGRLAKLETELAMQKSFSEEVKKSQSELDDFLQELDEDVEGMQSTILFLQQELKTTRDRIHILEKENIQLKQAHNSSSSQKETSKNAATTVKAATNGKSSNNNTNINNQLQPPISSNSIISSSSSSKLETIVENACLETTSNNVIAPTTQQHTATDYYNGNNNEGKAIVIEQIILTPSDDISKNGGAAARLARKRIYEEESVPIVCNVQELTPIVPVMREISAPRTLPPKKSKLRGIATRRSSQLEEEINLGLIPATTPQVLENTVTGMVSGEESTTAAVAAATTAAAAVTANVVDPAVVAAPLVVEDSAIDAAATPAAAASAGGAPARILTRRRSVRMQQNGGNGIDY